MLKSRTCQISILSNIPHTLNTTPALIINLDECTDFDSNLIICRTLRYAMNLRVPQRESKVHTSLNSVSAGLFYPTHKLHPHTHTHKHASEKKCNLTA